MFMLFDKCRPLDLLEIMLPLKSFITIVIILFLDTTNRGVYVISKTAC